MHKKKPGVDVILDVLKETLLAHPESEFTKSLLFQYQERGGLSKKQLEGLYGKASKVNSIPSGKLATLEAIILKKPTRQKSPLPVAALPVEKDTSTPAAIEAILEKYPQHKRVLFYKIKFENSEPLSAIEKAELERFKKLLIK